MSTGAPPSPAQQHNHEFAKPSAGSGSGVLKALPQLQHDNRRTSKSRQVPFKLRDALPTAISYTPQAQLERSTRKAPSTRQGAGPVFPASPPTRHPSKPLPTGARPVPSTTLQHHHCPGQPWPSCKPICQHLTGNNLLRQCKPRQHETRAAQQAATISSAEQRSAEHQLCFM
jgi:hypothetical protein